MPRLRKVFVRHESYFITFRTEQGLPFPATPLMNRILEGILCKAKSMYDIEVVAFTFMKNHFHLIITVTCPESVDDFIQYLKRESAHAVNRLLGRRKRTIWCAGYDSPIVLDQDKLLDRIAYIYTNPQESGQVDTAEEFPGVSSWRMFIDNKYEIRRNRLSRRALPTIGTDRISLEYQKVLLAELESSALEPNTFVLSPYAFMKSYKEDLTEEEIKSEIIERVRANEKKIREERKIPVIGRQRLITSGINLEYQPKKFGKRMICLSSFREKRVVYINWFKRLTEKACHLYKEARGKLHSLCLPPGAFAPGGFLSANVWASEF